MVKYSPVLVTGWSGLVGSAIQDIGIDKATGKYDRDLPTVIGVRHQNFDLLRWDNVDRMMNEYRPKAIIHLAAKVGGVKANMAAPATFFMENMTMNTHILEAAKKYSVNRVICFLSTCVFPDPCKLPLQPGYIHDGPPHHSNYGYAYAKRMLAVQCQAYNEQYGTSFLPVIPCNIYGPNDNFNLENSHVVPALIRKFVEAKTHDKPVTIWGSGTPLREFIFSRDIARLLMRILEEYDGNVPLVLSTGTEHSIKELVNTIANALNFKGEIIYDTSKPEGQHRKPSDNLPLRTLFPDFQFTSLQTGIEKTVDWFFANYPNGIRF